MPRIFLRAQWRNLIMVSYRAPAELLAPHIPQGLEIDPIDGGPTVSLVAFEFRDTRVFGVPWPGFRNFPEWNLRCYVRTRESGDRPSRRGVIFIREFVSSQLITQIARRTYNEPYMTAPLKHANSIENGAAACRYAVQFNDTDHVLEAGASSALSVPREGSVEHALKEQRWGFGRTRTGRGLCYEVAHQPWRVYEGTACRVDVDWARLYGEQWGVMQGAQPFSTMLVEGSAVTVSSALPL